MVEKKGLNNSEFKCEISFKAIASSCKTIRDIQKLEYSVNSLKSDLDRIPEKRNWDAQRVIRSSDLPLPHDLLVAIMGETS